MAGHIPGGGKHLNSLNSGGNMPKIGAFGIKIGDSHKVILDLHSKNQAKFMNTLKLAPGENRICLKHPLDPAALEGTFPTDGIVMISFGGKDFFLESKAGPDSIGKISNSFIIRPRESYLYAGVLKTEPLILGTDSEQSRILQRYLPAIYPVACIIYDEGGGKIRIESAGPSIMVRMVIKPEAYLTEKERQRIIDANAAKLLEWKTDLWGEFFIEANTYGEFLRIRRELPEDAVRRNPFIRMRQEQNSPRIRVAGYVDMAKFFRGFDYGDVRKIEEAKSMLQKRLDELMHKKVKDKRAHEKELRQVISELKQVKEAEERVSEKKQKLLQRFEGTVEISRARYERNVITY
ncbi:hypothetical protein ACFLZ2_05315 [Candidatus Margulisiibacteriota bacterium]